MGSTDLTGRVFGRWTVVSLAPRVKKRTFWNCICTCGVERIVGASPLVSGTTNSCGCLRVEIGRTHGARINLRHGEGSNGKETPEYRTWANMLSRCENLNHRLFPDYGARGIRVCDRWHKFENFLDDVGRRPDGVRGKRPLYSLDRFPDNNGNYEPGNVRWATPEEQNRNTRGNRIVTVRGVTMPLESALAEYGTSRKTFYNRITRGLSEEAAITTPPLKKNGLPR